VSIAELHGAHSPASSTTRRPERNRVTPLGEIVAIRQRGAWCANRGIIHRGHEIVRFHASKLWITCALEFRGQQLAQWDPHHMTLLFMYDEALSLAAGHRPCAYCRRPAYREFRDLLAAEVGIEPPLAADLDARLHAERLQPRSHRRRLHEAAWRDLPEGSFVLRDEVPHLVLADATRAWSAEGYATPTSRPASGTAVLLTPPSSLAALRAGYRPQIDDSART
jgi:hypothetical protein